MSKTMKKAVKQSKKRNRKAAEKILYAKDGDYVKVDFKLKSLVAYGLHHANRNLDSQLGRPGLTEGQ